LSNTGTGIALTQTGGLFAASTDPLAILYFQLLSGSTGSTY